MDGRVARFLGLAFGWPVLVATVLAVARIPLGSPVGLAAIALLYMPAPAVAALLVERRVVRERLAFPSGGDARAVARFFGLPVLAVVAVAVLLLTLTALFGNRLGFAPVGMLLPNMAALRAHLADLYGPDRAAQAQLPGSLALLVGVGVLGAVGAGWSINGILALGEEYGWRGFLWEAWRHHGVVRANLAIGAVWGLWHAPLIVQGFNYPGHTLSGVLVMIGFTTATSFLLTAIRERTGSVLPAAAAHGAINGVAPLLGLLSAGGDPRVSGIAGVLGWIALGLVAALLWLRLRPVTP